MNSALVCGYGWVEKTARSWDPAAVVEEIEPRLWVARVAGRPIGIIGKEPWSQEELARRAAALETHPPCNHDEEVLPDCPLGSVCAANDESPPTGLEGRNRTVCVRCGATVCAACGADEWYQVI